MKNKKKRKREMLCPQHFSQHFRNGRLLLAIVGGQKSNLSDGFKLELVTT